MKENCWMLASVVAFQRSAVEGELAPTTALCRAKTQQEQRSWECSKVFLTGKSSDQNLQLNIFLSPHSHQALLLSVLFILATYSISLTFLLLYLITEHLWLGRKWWETTVTCTLPLCVMCSWKWKAAWGGNLLACILPQCAAIYCSQESRYCKWGNDLFHTMLLWGNHGLKWKHANRPAPLEGFNKY